MSFFFRSFSNRLNKDTSIILITYDIIMWENMYVQIIYIKSLLHSGLIKQQLLDSKVIKKISNVIK